jgi:hypothetical protein
MQKQVIALEQMVAHNRTEMARLKKKLGDTGGEGVAIAIPSNAELLEEQELPNKYKRCTLAKCSESCKHGKMIMPISSLRDDIGGKDPRSLSAHAVWKGAADKLQCGKHQEIGIKLDDKHNMCIMCRVEKINTTASIACNTCKDHAGKMVKNHGLNDKRALIDTLAVLAKVMPGVEVTTTSEYNPVTSAPSGKAFPEDLDQGCAIDAMVKIETKTGTLAFCIEFQRTKEEKASVLAHKFAHMVSNTKPFTAFLFCVKIDDNFDHVYEDEAGKKQKVSMSFEQQLDVLRRYIIMAVRYHTKLPPFNVWTFFGDSVRAHVDDKANMPDYFENLHKAFSLAPAALASKSDWEFATDPMAGFLLPQARKGVVPVPKQWSHMRASVSEMHLMDLKKSFGQGFPQTSAPGFAGDMRCKSSCKLCTAAFGPKGMGIGREKKGKK